MAKLPKDKVKAVVVGGWMDKGVSQMITLIGAFDNFSEAYGEAYLYLDEMIADRNEQTLTITPLTLLEGDTGYAIFAINEKGEALYYADILFNENCQEVMQNADHEK